MNLRKMTSLKYLADQAALTFLRFPAVLVSAFLALALIIYQIETSTSGKGLQYTLSVLLGIPLFLALDLFYESKGWKKWRWRLIGFCLGVLFLAAYYWLTKDVRPPNYFFKYIQVSLALHLSVAFIQFTGKNNELEFWQFNKALFIRLFHSSLYATFFFSGLALALLTISFLFSVEIDFSHYSELWFSSVLILQTWHFLAGVPKNARERVSIPDYPRSLQFFVQYLLIPLITVYMVILYCYMAKILVTQNWPIGYVGWLVSVMSVLGILNLLLIDPKKNAPDGKWIKIYSMAYYVLTLPLLVMLLLAIGKRISVFGVTEPRFFLTVLGALLCGLAGYFIFSKKKSIKVIPLSLFFVSLVTLWGPVSAYTVSRKSQIHRAEEILAKKKTHTLSEEDEIQLSSVFYYLVRNHGLESFKDLLPDKDLSRLQMSKNPETIASAVMREFDLQYTEKPGEQRRIPFSYKAEIFSNGISLKGFQHLALLNLSPPRSTVDFQGQKVTIVIDGEKMNITFSQRKVPLLTLSLKDFIKRLQQDWGERSTATPLKEMTLNAQGQGLKVKVIVYELRGRFQDDVATISAFSGVALLGRENP